MILSMTGYGKSRVENDAVNITAEVKTLNSKYLDANIRLPRSFSSYEIEVRNIISEVLKRGKVSLTVEMVEKKATAVEGQVDEELLKSYFRTYQKIANELNESPPELFRLAAQSPEVIQVANSNDADPAQWKIMRSCIEESLQHCTVFRRQEGDALEKDFEQQINHITETLVLVQEQLPHRNSQFRKRLEDQMNDLAVEAVDDNRFEQEMIYYLEKLDISEEVVRLKNHLSFFSKVLAEPQASGKKLGFISQEIGREINTIGAKANDTTIQHHVVRMKEALEKIKEQVLNVL